MFFLQDLASALRPGDRASSWVPVALSSCLLSSSYQSCNACSLMASLFKAALAIWPNACRWATRNALTPGYIHRQPSLRCRPMSIWAA